MKVLIQSTSPDALRRLGVSEIRQWLNVELPRVQGRRVDLLGRTAEGLLVHIELQSANDALMRVRMAEYALAIYRKYGSFPIQVLIYIGNASLRMSSEIRERDFRFRYRLLDVRNLPSGPLLASDRVADNILGILAGQDERVGSLRAILRRIARLRGKHREEAMQWFLLTCRLRGLSEAARKEIRTMPVTFNFDLKDYVREAYEEGLEEGRSKGLAKGREQGVLEGRRSALLNVMNHRFGSVPSSVTRRVAALSRADLDRMFERVLSARSLTDLFPSRRSG
jgi:predicted transposase YdaD